jgi:alpha-mannosidase
MKANKIIIVPETHWDREWYLPFQEFRARLVLMMDDLLKILKNNPNYRNFTFDGQTIPIEDYLEVRPQAEEDIKKYGLTPRATILRYLNEQLTLKRSFE